MALSGPQGNSSNGVEPGGPGAAHLSQSARAAVTVHLIGSVRSHGSVLLTVLGAGSLKARCHRVAFWQITLGVISQKPQLLTHHHC